MTLTERPALSAVHLAIGASIAAVFFADVLTPLGVAVWVLYLVPVGLTFFTLTVNLPLAVCAGGSVLLAVGFVLSPPPPSPSPGSRR